VTENMKAQATARISKVATGVRKIVHPYSGQRQAAHSPIDEVADEEGQAALRQMSTERLMGYGVHHPDALELRGRVWSGEDWQTVATELAEICLSPPECTAAPESDQTRANRLLRASALLRMSQMMMVDNSPERSAIFARAGRLYEDAADLRGDPRRMIIETPNGPLVGWLHRSKQGDPVGRAVVIGGVEGWAMDFDGMAGALTERGIEALLLDGPGQGESRMQYHHYLKVGWEADYSAVFDMLETSEPRLPIGFVGNSMGGAVGMHLAKLEPRIAAFCDNGGSPRPGRDRGQTTFAYKMAAHVGDVTLEEASKVWRTLIPVDPDNPVRCPLLVVHGGRDPLVSDEDAQAMFEAGVSDDRQLVVFEDGDHCIYNHADDKHALIGDWLASRLENA